jgi:hypothetical protein
MIQSDFGYDYSAFWMSAEDGGESKGIPAVVFVVGAVVIIPCAAIVIGLRTKK